MSQLTSHKAVNDEKNVIFFLLMSFTMSLIVINIINNIIYMYNEYFQALYCD